MGEVIPLFGQAAADVVASLRIASPGESESPAQLDAPRGASRRPRRAAGGDAPPAEFTDIEEASLRALGRRSLSRRELERQLGQLGFHEHAVSDELDRLEGVGLIDDFALAQHLVARLQERKGLAGSAIKAELARRVLSPAAIDYAMDLIDTGDELAAARELAEKRARQYRGLDPATAERRLSAYLMRRGFSASTIRAAIESVRSA